MQFNKKRTANTETRDKIRCEKCKIVFYLSIKEEIRQRQECEDLGIKERFLCKNCEAKRKEQLFNYKNDMVFYRGL